jgi:hypothetical protein
MHIGGLELFDQQSGSDLIGIPTDHGLPIGEGPNTPIFWTAAPTAGQILIGTSSTSDPVLNTITAGPGISITNAPGSITISSSATGLGWSLISASQTLASNRGYICIGGGNLVLTLPGAPSLGDLIEVVLDGSTSWMIQLPGGVTALYGSTPVTSSLTSTYQGDAIRFVCQSATKWNVLSSIGNIITV